MAARSNQQSSITLTLPVSCQICLGKVKQPVLCPNLHVFCNLCLDIWLKRNSQCPACRVDIGPDNPVKHIIGGQLEDEDKRNKSTPDLRRARFDLLYNEYEDQFEKMRKEIIILRTENNILSAQLKDAEEENENHKKGKGETVSSTSSQSADSASLLMLTRNLQEAQKLYTGIKGDMSQLKQENAKLKDENVNLTRENETLRLEIAQRSPKKFGRYTVATLETKIAEKDKEIRQLTKALERSDTYIEELQRELEKLSGKDGAQKGGPSKTSTSKASSQSERQRFQINLEPQDTTGDDFSFRHERPPPSVDSARKILFGKVLVDDPVRQNQNFQNCSQPNEVPHAYTQNGPVATEQRKSRSVSGSTSTMLNGFHGGSSNDVGMLDVGNQPPESIIKSSHRVPTSQPEDMEMDSQEQERTPKKVHFNVPSKTDDTSSFNLELPSPMEKSGVSSMSSSVNRVTSTTGLEGDVNEEGNNEFDQKILNLLKRNNMATSTSSTSINEPRSDMISPRILKKKPGSKQVKKSSGSGKTQKSSKKLQAKNSNDSSHLSVPDPDTPKGKNDHDLLREIKTELDLDISMTPELTDCLHLMNRAEKNISDPHPGVASTAPFPSQSSRPTEGSGNPIAASIPRPSSVPPNLSNGNQRLPPASLYMASSTTNPKGFAPSSSTISSWEQQFFSTLKANPYKYNNSSKPSDPPVRIKQEPGDWNNDGEIESQNLYSSLDLSASKKSASSRKYDFSHAVTVTRPSSYGPNYIFTDPTRQALEGISSNPFSLHLGPPQTSDASGPASSIDYSRPNFSRSSSHVDSTFKTEPSSYLSRISSQPSSLISSLASSTTAGNGSDSLGFKSSSYLPSYKSSTSTHPPSLYDNPLPSSLNNSELEWPGDTPTKKGKSHQTNYDDLPRPSKSRVNGYSNDNFDNNFHQSSYSEKQRNFNYISNASDSDLNASTFLPEPKKRLFDTEDDLDFTSSPKTTRR